MKGSLFTLVSAFALAGGAQAFTYHFEGLADGSILGQDGWAATEAGTANATVDNAIFSPMGGSTQSLRMHGGSTSTRIARFMGETINAGVYTVGYDMRHSARIGSASNLVMSTLLYHGGTTSQMIQPFAQNGGGAGAAQNVFADTDGLGGSGYGATGWVTETLIPETWYRFEFEIDFGAKKFRSGKVYDISSGSKVLHGESALEFFFNNDGTNWFDQLDRFGVRLGGQTDAGEGWNIDNFSIVPEPASMAALGLGVAAMMRRRRKN